MEERCKQAERLCREAEREFREAEDASGAPHAEARMWLETALDQKLLVHVAVLHQPASEAAAQKERRE